MTEDLVVEAEVTTVLRPAPVDQGKRGRGTTVALDTPLQRRMQVAAVAVQREAAVMHPKTPEEPAVLD